MLESEIRQTADALNRVLQEGLSQDEAVVHYLENVLGECDPERLAALAMDKDFDEREAVIDMLLYPGETLKRRLEPVLERAALAPADVPKLAGAVFEASSLVEAVFPDGSRLALRMTPEEAAVLVGRLRPADTPPPALAAALQDAPKETAAAAKVRLRHARLSWSRPRTRFMESLLRRLDHARDDFLDVVSWALAFLDAAPENEPPAVFLGPRRRELAAHLKSARRQEKALLSSNFETLLMQGARLPHLHPASLIREMEMLDACSLAVLGRTAASLDMVEERDLGDIDDAARLMKLLGGSG